jgi:hypothetical protein
MGVAARVYLDVGARLRRQVMSYDRRRTAVVGERRLHHATDPDGHECRQAGLVLRRQDGHRVAVGSHEHHVGTARRRGAQLPSPRLRLGQRRHGQGGAADLITRIERLLVRPHHAPCHDDVIMARRA